MTLPSNDGQTTTSPLKPLQSILARRDILKIGSLGIAASALPFAQSQLVASDIASTTSEVDSVVLLWMAGGVTHLESFDPKPEAPEQIRGTLDPIATAIPGIAFGEVMPGLARLANELAILRSYSHDSNDHFLSQGFALSGRRVNLSQITTEPNVGAIVSYLKGSRSGLPGYIAIPGTTRPGPPPHNLFVGGWLGGQYGPFAVGGQPDEPDFTVPFARDETPVEIVNEDLRPPALALRPDLTSIRLSRRDSLRKQLDQRLLSLEQSNPRLSMDNHYQHAFHLLGSPSIRSSFNLSEESDVVRESYGRTKIGSRCLLARRLVEADARFVMVDYGYDPDYGNLWDNHAVPVQRQPHISEIAKKSYHLAGVDRACSALIRDLKERGRLDRTLVVFLTEFGRTPTINANGGRDHWGPAGSLFFAGGGIQGGQVIGNTDKHASYPTGRGYSPADVAATIYAKLGIPDDTILYDRQKRPVPLLPEGDAISELTS
jgi:hypothetical protein